jgi:hypothetical protein
MTGIKKLGEMSEKGIDKRRRRWYSNGAVAERQAARKRKIKDLKNSS